MIRQSAGELKGSTSMADKHSTVHLDGDVIDAIHKQLRGLPSVDDDIHPNLAYRVNAREFHSLIADMKAALNPVTTWDDDMLKMAMKTIQNQRATWTGLVNRLIAITGDGSRSDMVQ